MPRTKPLAPSMSSERQRPRFHSTPGAARFYREREILQCMEVTDEVSLSDVNVAKPFDFEELTPAAPKA